MKSLECFANDEEGISVEKVEEKYVEILVIDKTAVTQVILQ